MATAAPLPPLTIKGSFSAARRPTKVKAIRFSEQNRDEVFEWMKEFGKPYYGPNGELILSSDNEFPVTLIVAYVGDYIVYDQEKRRIAAQNHKKFWESFYTP